MKLRTWAVCAALLFGSAGSALADTNYLVKLEAPVPSAMKFMAAHAMWSCVASTCGSGGAPEESLSVSACKELAKKVGKIVSYGDTTHKLSADEREDADVQLWNGLSADELEKCNSAAGH